MARTNKLGLGAAAEDEALLLLQSSGLQTLTRNYRCRMGEIDLVMRDREVLVFVEVRHRRQNRFASAAESVDIHKQRKLIRAALSFLGQNAQYADCPVRFDVVAFDSGLHESQSVNWIRDAFRPE